jgi:hypothetical protein
LGCFNIDLGDINQEYCHAIIPEIEEIMKRGIKLFNPDEYYYPHKEAYYVMIVNQYN